MDPIKQKSAVEKVHCGGVVMHVADYLLKPFCDRLYKLSFDLPKLIST